MIYWKLIYEFFTIGLFTYGGGLAMIPLLRNIAVSQYHWLSNIQFANLFAISQSTPGPIAINMATFIGYQQGHILGSIITSLVVILPAFIIVIIVAKFLQRFNEHPFVKSAMIGLKASILGLILTAIVVIAKESLFLSSKNVNIFNFFLIVDLKAIVLFAFMIFAVLKYKKHPIVYISIAGIIGMIIF